MNNPLRKISPKALANARAVIVLVTCAVVLWMLFELGEGEVMRIDAGAQALLVDTLRAPWLTPAMQGITDLAAPCALIAVWLAVAALSPNRRTGVAMGVNLGAAFVINQLLKFVIQRPRPDGIGLVEASGYSFPSGHSMVAMAFYGFLVYLVWHSEKGRAERALWCGALGLLILGIGVSRIYLGVHYATDVIAGLLISLAWLAVYTKAIYPTIVGTSGQGTGARGLACVHRPNE